MASVASMVDAALVLRSLFMSARALRPDDRPERAAETVGVLSGSARDRLVWMAIAALERMNVLWRMNFSVRGHIEGRAVTIPLIRGEGVQLIRGDQPWTYALLRRLLADADGAFVDVGACLGRTLIKVKAIDPKRLYYGFEPNPWASHYCRELIRVNRYENATVFPIGLSSAATVIRLSKAEADRSAGVGSGFRCAEGFPDVQPASVHTGDDVLLAAGVTRVGVVKIDVAGVELDVMKGLLGTVRRDRPRMLCTVGRVHDETTPAGALGKQRQERLATLLGKLNYAIYRLDSRGTPTVVDGFGGQANIGRATYLFAPREQPVPS
jgi:FkbM family methyltransferase